MCANRNEAGDLDLDGYADALVTVRLANGATAIRLLRNVACTDGVRCLQYDAVTGYREDVSAPCAHAAGGR